MPDERNTTIDQNTALVLADRTQSIDLYRTMCAAIAECARVDQVQEIRNRVKALEEYTRQSKNFEAEAQLSAIRMRAERKAGELLIEMAENGERYDNRGSNMRVRKSFVPSLSDLNVAQKDAEHWQQLARIPATEFEAALSMPGIKRTYKVVAAYREKHPVMPKAAKQVGPPKQGGTDNGDYQRRLVCESAMKMADGKVRSVEQICQISGRSDVEQFLARARMLPWLKIERTADGYRLSVDEELRLICEDHCRPFLICVMFCRSSRT